MQAGFTINGKQYNLTDAIATGTYPAPLLKALYNTRDSEYPSASSIANCLRQFQLRRRIPEYPTPQSLLAPAFGTAFHKMMEDNTEPEVGVYTELQMETELTFDDLPEPFNRVKVRGMADYIDKGRGLLRDYKTKRYMKADIEVTQPHRIQANIYAWLWWREAGSKLTDCEIVYLDQGNIKVCRIQLGDPLEWERYVGARLHRYAKAESESRLVKPVPEYFESNTKNRGQCNWCPVKEACTNEWRRANV